MYCQTSSSVQFESGNIRRLSPSCTRVLKRLQSFGLWLRGSHWPRLSRKEKTLSFARDRSSSRLAPPIAASKPPFLRPSSNAVVFKAPQHRRVPHSNGFAPLSRAERFL